MGWVGSRSVLYLLIKVTEGPGLAREKTKRERENERREEEEKEKRKRMSREQGRQQQQQERCTRVRVLVFAVFFLCLDRSTGILGRWWWRLRWWI